VTSTITHNSSKLPHCKALEGTLSGDYKFEPIETKKLLDNVKEILESENETMIDALKANIKAFLEAVRTNKKENENKGDDQG